MLSHYLLYSWCGERSTFSYLFTSGTLTAENQDAADNFLLYWQSRESPVALGLTGIKARPPLKKDAVPEELVPHEGELSKLESLPDLTFKEARKTHESGPILEDLGVHEGELSKIRSKPIKERVSVSGNNEEAKLYASLSREITSIRKLGQGSFASVDLIQIGDKQYARRIELLRSPNREKWEADKKAERTTYLLLEVIGRKHPNEVVITPDLSFVSEGQYVSLWPVVDANLLTATHGRPKLSTKPVPHIPTLVKQLSKNLEVLHEGVLFPDKLPPPCDKGEWQLSFFHNDIKEENIGLTSEGKPVFMDFGFSQPVVWRKLDDNTYEAKSLTTTNEGEWLVSDLPQILPRGTPPYMDRELILISFHKLTSNDQRFRFLKDANVSALNVVNYQIATGNRYRSSLWHTLMKKEKEPKFNDIGDYWQLYLSPESEAAVRHSKLGERPILKWDDKKKYDDVETAKKLALDVLTASR